MDNRVVADVLEQAADAVQAWFDRGVERGLSGQRHGQYGLDLAADAVVVPLLLDAGFGVLSEESGLQHGDRDILVVVDPVDGSTNADRGIPVVGCSLCAVDVDGPFVGVVRDLGRRVTYRATRGSGATRDGATIVVRSVATVDDSIVGINGWARQQPPGAQFRALGCASVELCLVADGTLDGYVNLDLDGHGPWDYLAGLLMVSEAGGRVAELVGRDLSDIGHDVRRAVAVGANVDVCRSLIDTYVTGQAGRPERAGRR